MRPILLLVTLALIPLSAAGQQAADPLTVALNGAFRKDYAAARAATLAQIDPVIVARGDRLLLIAGGERREGPAIPVGYHERKSAAHAPLLVFVLLAPHLDRPLSAEVAARIAERVAVLARAGASLAGRELDEPSRTRMATTIERSRAFLEANAREGAVVTRAALDTLCRGLRREILGLADAAARIRLAHYHRTVVGWRAGPLADRERWAALRVVISGASMPRQQALATQYFARVLGERGEGRRIIYAESRFADALALARLGTDELDRQIGVAFFGDPWRMHRDLLASATSAALDELEWDALTGR